jgi:hypothetical protein
MCYRELHIVRKRPAALGIFFGDHVKDVLELPLRLCRRGPNCMATLDSRNKSDVAAVVVSPANDLVVKQRLHFEGVYLIPPWDESKIKRWPSFLVLSAQSRDGTSTRLWRRVSNRRVVCAIVLRA